MFSCRFFNLARLFSTLLAVYLVACNKVSAFELETNEERLDRQAEMLKKIDSRTQVSDFSLHGDYFSISFTSGETFRLSYEGTPVFCVGDDNKWYVNGTDTGRTINKQDSKVQIPEISTDQDGNWIIDGATTFISAHSILTPEDLEHSYISHIIFADDWIHVFLFEGEPVHVPVITDSFYQVPSYFLDSLVKKERMAAAILESAGDECASFVFFTDTHWGRNTKHSPAIIRHITDYTKIQDVYFGGDVITSFFPDKETPMDIGKEFQSAFSFLGPKFYCVYGNHDNNSDSQSGKVELHLSDEQVFSWLQSQMTDVTFGDYFNFYRDDPDSKTRVIGLDTGRCYYYVFRDRLHLTVHFAVDALSTLPPDWHAVFVSHIWCDATKKDDGSYPQKIASYIAPVLKVFDDFNNRTAGKYVYNKQTVNYDFSNAAGRIELCIGGHTHVAYDTRSEGGIPVVIVNSDSVKNPETGTINEQSVTLAVADFKSRKLYLFVIGRGEDRIIAL